jgi:hypothetical protein
LVIGRWINKEQPITNNSLLWSFLQLGAFFRNDRPFYRTDLQANPAVDTGGKVNPVPVRPLGIFTGAGVNASNWAGIDAIGDALASVGNDGMWHGVLSRNYSIGQLFLAYQVASIS